MRLIHVDTLQLREFYDETTLPQYAILSHTWSDDEIALQEFEQLVAGGSSAETTRAKNGYKKIVAACKAAKELQIYWCWVDTCCIDKKSSAELTEAINSMFKWYMHAAVCLAYLSDLDVMTESQYIRRELPKMMYCRWFTRGWCLQELIAPENLIFYDKEWNTVTTKAEISPYLSDITGIDQGVLQDPTKLPSIPVACRLSWASRRETTRVEDQAYCLLGIFNITMPMLYGEGPKSFLRLQEEILRQDGDLSLFAWLPDAGQHEIYMDMFALSPKQFTSSLNIFSTTKGNLHTRDVCSISNRGVQMSRTNVISIQTDQRKTSPYYYVSLGCYSKSVGPWVLKLKMVGPGVYVRLRLGDSRELAKLEDGILFDKRDIYILPRITQSLLISIKSYHRSSFYFSYISPETAQLLEASPEEAFDVVGRRFLTRDLYDFRAHIKFIPDANHPELFCILLLKLEGQNPQPRLPSVHLLPPVVWSRDILGKSYNFAQLVEHSILLADRETAEHDGIQQLAVGRHVFSVHLITGEQEARKQTDRRRARRDNLAGIRPPPRPFEQIVQTLEAAYKARPTSSPWQPT
ncbi:hypothetical protein PG989_012335 [Apiospora arundinis]